MNDGRADYVDALADQWDEQQECLFDIWFEEMWWVRVITFLVGREVAYELLQR